MTAGSLSRAEDMLDLGYTHLSRYDHDAEAHQLLRASCDPQYRDFLAMKPGESCDDGSVIVGHSGYLFVNDGSNAWKDQLSGQAVISEEDLSATSAMLDASARRCAELGIGFSLVVYPEKDVVYPEFSPNVSGGVYPDRSVRRIMSKTEVRSVYPLSDMLLNKETTQQFHRRNSHVQFYGGLIAANATLRALGKAPLSLQEVPTDLVSWPDDLSIKWVDNLNTFRRRVKPVFERKTHFAPEHGHVGTEVETTNVAAPYDETLLIFGDSYSWNQDAGLLAFLALRYRTVYFVWKKQIDWSLVERLAPTEVILETAERFLIRGIK